MISDPIAEYIDSQQPVLTDFIFRLTGDRSRAGVVAKDVCLFIKDDLSSSWSEEEVRVRLFARAYELNADALRGIEKSFLEPYYRHQFPSVDDVNRYYPWEIFLAGLLLDDALSFLLCERYMFKLEDAAEILGKSPEDIQKRVEKVDKMREEDPRLLVEDLRHLPYYGFLAMPEGEHSSLSHIMESMITRIRPRKRSLIMLLIGLGLAFGVLLYLLSANWNS